jgi:hypothetical protein
MVIKAQPVKFDVLMSFNDKFHNYMGDLQMSDVHEEAVFIKPQLIQGIITDIVLAEEELKEPKLKIYYDQFVLFAKIKPVLASLKPEANGLIELSKSAWLDLQAIFLNQMANLVHNAAAATVEISGKLKGCSDVGKFKPDDSKAVSKYCSGVTSGSVLVTTVPLKKVTLGTGESLVQQYPSYMKHSLGCHSVMPSVQNSGDELAMAVEYHDSDSHYEPGSTYRLKGVNERLIKQGFKCGVKNPSGIQTGKDILYCNKSDLKPDEIRELATYFSYLLNGDTSGQGTAITALVRDGAWDYALAENQKHGDSTWESAHQGQLNWGTLKSKMEEEAKFTKNVIYNDLRELLILRDIHHMIEEKYDIDHNTVTMIGMKAIVENGKKMQAILSKNHWKSVQSYINQIESYIAQGKPIGISGPSDAIGHITHAVIYDMLAGIGQYGGCSMKGSSSSISNINTGNLAYCEGILAGESGLVVPNTAGNNWMHKILPMTITTAVDEDDFSDFQYAFKINLPPDKNIALEIGKYLKTQGLMCAGNQCKIATKDLNKIRNVALFLSNLKGVDNKIGEECLKKAIEDAEKAAITQAKKGIFAFTQEPIHTSNKEWIDLCFKQYGIAPPNMTKEELEIHNTLGTSKVYGGCSFGQSDIVPNLGYLKYCEGVRKNPVAKVNAIFTSSGNLTHLYHGQPGSPDSVATISVTPVENGMYEMNISNLDMRDKDASKPLQKLVMKRLVSLDFTSQDMANAHTAHPISAEKVRGIAGYLSSMHQAASTGAVCIPKTEEYAFSQSIKLPKDISAHDKIVYPWDKAQWDEVVCGKPAGTPVQQSQPTVTTAPMPTEENILKALASGPLTNPQFHDKFAGKSTLLAETLHKLVDNSHIVMPAGSQAWEITMAGGKYLESLSQGPLPGELGFPQPWDAGIVYKSIKNFEGKYKNVGGCQSYTASKPTQAKAAFCSGVHDVVKIAGVPTKIQVAKLSPTSNYLVIYKTGKINFQSKGTDLYITLPDSLMHPLIVDYLIKYLHWKQDGQTFSGVSYKYTLFSTAKFFSYLHGFGALDEECKKKAIQNAKDKAKVKTYGGVAEPYEPGDWKIFCEPPLTPEAVNIAVQTAKDKLMGAFFKLGITHNLASIKQWTQQQDISDEYLAMALSELVSEGKLTDTHAGSNNLYSLASEKKKLSDLTPGELSLLNETVCAWKKEGTSLVGVFNKFDDLFTKIEFGAMTKSAITEWYEACPEPDTELSLYEKTKAAVMEYHDKFPEEKFHWGKIAKWIWETYGIAEPKTSVVVGLTDELVAEGKISKINDYLYFYAKKETPGQLKKYILEFLSKHPALHFDINEVKGGVLGGNLLPPPLVSDALQELVQEGKIIKEIGSDALSTYQFKQAAPDTSKVLINFGQLDVASQKEILEKISAHINAGQGGTAESYVEDTLKVKLSQTLKTFISQLNAIYLKTHAKDNLDKTIDAYAAALKSTQSAMSIADAETIKEYTEYKKLPDKYKSFIHDHMAYFLLSGVQAGIPYEQTITDMQELFLKEYGMKITPLMVKLQLDLEKKKLICNNVLPTEPGLTQVQACEIVTEEKAIEAMEKAGIEIPVEAEPAEGQTAANEVAWNFIKEKLLSGHGPGGVWNELKEYWKGSQLPFPQIDLNDIEQIGDNLMWGTMEDMIHSNVKVVSDVTKAAVKHNLKNKFPYFTGKPGFEKDFDFHWKLYTKKDEPVSTATGGILSYVEGIMAVKSLGDNWLTADDIFHIWKNNPEDLGKPATIQQIQSALEQLTSEGKLLWQITGNKYHWNMAQNKPGAKKPKATQEQLINHALNDLFFAPDNKLSFIQIENKIVELGEFSFESHELSSALNELVETGKVKDVGTSSYQLVTEEEKPAAEKSPAYNFFKTFFGLNQGAYAIQYLEAEAQAYSTQEIHEALGKLVAEGLVNIAGIPPGYYQAKKAMKEPKVNVKDILAINDAKTLINVWLEGGTHPDGDGIYNYLQTVNPKKYTYQVVSDAINEMNTAGIIEWKMLAWYLVEKPAEQEELTDAQSDAIKAKVLKYMVASPDSFVGSGEISDEIGETEETVLYYLGQLVEENKVAYEDGEGKWILTNLGGMEETANIYGEDEIKDKVLAVINGAPSDFDWSLEYILEGLNNNYSIKTNEDVILPIVKQLAKEGKIMQDEDNNTLTGEWEYGPWHSKMTIKEEDGVKFLAPIDTSHMKYGGNWYFKVTSDAYGEIEYGPYDTEEDADASINNIQATADKLNDGIQRTYTLPYQEEEEPEPNLLASVAAVKVWLFDWIKANELSTMGNGLLEEELQDAINNHTDFANQMQDMGINLGEILDGMVNESAIKESSGYYNTVKPEEEIKPAKLITELTDTQINETQDYISEMITQDKKLPYILAGIYAHFPTLPHIKANENWVKEQIAHIEKEAKSEVDKKPPVTHYNKFKITQEGVYSFILSVFKHNPDSNFTEKELYEHLAQQYTASAKDVAGALTLLEANGMIQVLAGDTGDVWKLKKQPKVLKPFSQISDSLKLNVQIDVMDLANIGKTLEEICTWVGDKYSVKCDAELTAYVAESIEKWALKQKEEMSPEGITENSMKILIKQGMTPKAMADLFVGAGKMSKTQIESKAKKLHLGHKAELVKHPELKPAEKNFADLPLWLRNKIKAVEYSLVNKGWGYSDVVAYIANNYNLNEASVAEMISHLHPIPQLTKEDELLAAFKTLGIGEELGNCRVDSDGISKLAEQTSAYCQGVMSPAGIKPEAIIKEQGIKVVHKAQSQQVIFQTEKEQGSWKSKLDGTVGNLAPQVAEILDGWGFNCASLNGMVACDYKGSNGESLPLEDGYNIKKAAIFLSSITNVPALPQACQSKALEYAKNHAVGISKTGKPWAVNVFPATVEDWDKTVCQKVK